MIAKYATIGVFVVLISLSFVWALTVSQNGIDIGATITPTSLGEPCPSPYLNVNGICIKSTITPTSLGEPCPSPYIDLNGVCISLNPLPPPPAGGVVCGDGTCDVAGGETALSCPADCPVTACGDGINWTKQNSGNPVLDVSAGKFDSIDLYYPSVIFDGTTYKMWYAARDGPGYNKIGYATSTNGITWTKQNSGNPVLDVSAGKFDSYLVNSPSVIFNGTTYKMWYTGSELIGDSRIGYQTVSRIGYATSTNGITWTKQNSGNAVLDKTAGKFDSLQVYHPSVIFDGTTYKMWYTGAAIGDKIGYATSPDGISWTKQNNGDPVLDVSADKFDSSGVSSPSVIFDGTTYKMWYSGWNGANTKIGYATSNDGITWTKQNSGNAVLDKTAGKFDSSDVSSPSVILDGTTYEMWYTGSDVQGYSKIGYATSTACSSSVPPVGTCNNDGDCDAGEDVGNCAADCMHSVCGGENLSFAQTGGMPAMKIGNETYQLTSSSLSGSGAVWNKNKVDVTKDFWVTWDYKGNESNSNQGSDQIGGDGYAFIIQNESYQAIKDGAYQLGYAGISRGIAVEFDEIKNINDYNPCVVANPDPSGNHISIQGMYNNNLSVCTRDSLEYKDIPGEFNDGNLHNVVIVYNATRTELKIYYDGNTTARIVKTINLAQTVGFNQGYFGFTAGTAGARARHMIFNWAINGKRMCNLVTNVTGNGNAYWTNAAGQSINSSSLGNAVRLVVEAPNVSDGAWMLFDIYEKADIGSDHLVKLSQTLSDSVIGHKAYVMWSISESEIKAGGGNAGTKGIYELYFKASTSQSGGFSQTSGILNVPENSVINTPPVANITSPIDGGVYLRNDNILFNHSSYDAESSVSVSWSVSDGSLPANKITLNSFYHNFTINGTKIIRLTVTDNRGLTDTDEVAISVLGNGTQLFTHINNPTEGDVLFSRDVLFDGSGSYIIKTTGSSPSDYNVECLGGACPLSVSCTSCNIPINDPNNKRGDYSMLNFTWTFGSDIGLPLKVYGFGIKSGSHTYSGYGTKEIKLNLSANGLNGVDLNSFRILQDSCDVINGIWYDSNGDGHSTGSDGICDGTNGIIGDDDDCCPIRMSCANVGGIAKCIGCNFEYLIPPQNNTIGEITLCEHYNYIDGGIAEKELQCDRDCNHLFLDPNGPQQRELDVIRAAGNNITSESCQWIEGMCGVGYVKNGIISEVRTVISSGECIDNSRTIQTITYTNGVAGPIAESTERCEVIVVPLSFFGKTQFIGVILLIIIVYLVYWSLKKGKHESSGKIKGKKRRK